jgi:ubiquinone/menaquinone biosynthesis C-methylase UbiE
MPALNILSSSEYDAFAPYYDAFTADSDYESWTLHVLELLRDHGLRGHALLDLACGSGKSFAPFLERGFERRAHRTWRSCTPTCARCPGSAASTWPPASTTR